MESEVKKQFLLCCNMLDLSFKIYTAGTRLKELSQKESFTITMYIKDTSIETLAVDI